MFKSILETNGCVCVRLHLSPYFILDLETNIQSSFVSILYFRFRKIKKKQHKQRQMDSGGLGGLSKRFWLEHIFFFRLGLLFFFFIS